MGRQKIKMKQIENKLCKNDLFVHGKQTIYSKPEYLSFKLITRHT